MKWKEYRVLYLYQKIFIVDVERMTSDERHWSAIFYSYIPVRFMNL